MSTDTAFAFGVLAPGGPARSRMRHRLLTLAVVDDLVALMVIATVYEPCARRTCGRPCTRALSCPTACPTRPQCPMGKPETAGIIRVPGVRVPSARPRTCSVPIGSRLSISHRTVEDRLHAASRPTAAGVDA